MTDTIRENKSVGHINLHLVSLLLRVSQYKKGSHIKLVDILEKFRVNLSSVGYGLTLLAASLSLIFYI